MGNIYVSKQTGEKVKIVKEEESFYTLDDGVKIKKETFSKRYEQSDEIDPMEFLNPPSALEQLANQLKNVDPNKVVNEPEHSTRIKMKPPTVLADNSRQQSPIANNSSEGIQISEQRKQQMIEEWRMKQELGDPDAVKPAFMENQPNQDDGYIEYEMPKEGEGRIRQTSHTNPTQPTTQQPPVQQIDPLQMMFKMFKNNYDVKLTFEIEEKIANPQFIEMVMENVDGDAIEYYTKKILDKILKNPLKLKKDIYNQLELEVYGEEYVFNKKNEQKKSEENSEENSDSSEKEKE